MTDQLVIFLHGVGSNGADLAALGSYWNAQLPNTTFASPDGPYAFDQGGAGRQWFSVNGVTPENRVARIQAARPEFDRVIGEIIASAGFQDRLDRVAFVGFSQGSIMALDAIATGRWAVGAVLAYSGRLATPERMTPSLATKVMLIHGTADRVIPVGETQMAQERLTQAGVSVQVQLEQGMHHGISAKGVEIGGDFLAQALAVPVNATR